MANNRKPSGLICLIIVLGALLHNTGAVQLQDKWVGDDVILQPKYIGVPSEITWRKNDMKVVHMMLSPQENVVYYFLEDRAAINRTNGALTIKNLTIEDRGIFEADVLVNDISQYTRIYLNIQVPHAEKKTVGDDITLEPQYTGDPSEIRWTVNSNTLVEMSLKPQVEIIFYRLQDRATISPTNGSLTIRKLTIEDSGMYKAEVTVNDVIQETRINVTVSKYSGLSAWIIALIVVLAVIIIPIIIIVLWRCYYKTQSQEVTFEASEVTLNPQYFEYPSKITWKINDKKLKPLDDGTIHRLQDRATIDRTNGSLTIRDLTIDDDGLYEAGVLVNDDYQYTKKRLTVREEYACITVTFQTENQPKGNPCLTIHNVKPEEHGQYALKVFHSDGEKSVFDIKEKNGIVNIRTENDRVTLTKPDAEKVTNITLKKGNVTLFQWKVFGLTLHTNNIALEPGFVTVNNAEGKGSYRVEVHSTNNHITNTTLQLKADNQGNECSTNRDAGCEAVAMVPLTDNGLPESQPMITFHPVNLTNEKTTWKKDGQLVKIDGKRIIYGVCGDLTINKVTLGDGGKYTAQCKGQEQEQEFIFRM